jgi:cob(I)alamin adenosyltransferase
MKIYTKTGDKGTTALYGGKRVSKADLRIDAYGTIDELNSYIGLLNDQPVNNDKKNILLSIQNELFNIGSHLAADPEKPNLKLPSLKSSDIEVLENEIDMMNEVLPELRYFILPGGHQSVSFCHIARTVCRRAERKVIELNEISPVNDLIIIYLNRLSDYLFVLARKMGQELNIEEVPWRS